MRYRRFAEAPALFPEELEGANANGGIDIFSHGSDAYCATRGGPDLVWRSGSAVSEARVR